MNRYSAYLKTRARITLQGRYGSFSAGLLLIALISMILNTLPVSLLGQVPGISGIFLRFLLSFAVSVFISMLMVGISRMALQACRGQETSFSDLFFAFSSQSDRLLTVKVILTAMTLVLEIPDFLLAWQLNSGAISDFLYYGLTMGWRFLSVFLSAILTMWFSLSIYLLIDRQELSALESLKQHAALMRGRKRRYLYLRVSFAGMYLLGILSCFLGFLWILPYQETSLVCFYLDTVQTEAGRSSCS